VNLSQLKEFDVVTFAYEADKPGFPKPGMQPPNPYLYDANPLIVLTDIRMIKGKHLLYGLNANYLMTKFARGRLILSFREGSTGTTGNAYINKSVYDRTIHSYRLDRVKSELFKPRNVVVDRDLLTSMANWKQIKKKDK
jgi:hypothetical protein